MQFGYSSFSAFRDEIMRAAGYKFEDVESDYGRIRQMPVLDYDSFQVDDNLFGFWNEDPGDPLIYVYWHSDCEGGLSPYQLEQLIPRLKEIAPTLVSNYRGIGWDFTQYIYDFIEMCQYAAEHNESVVFS